MTEYLIRFTFGKGIKFEAPEATSGILLPLLQRVWTKDNHQDQVLMELGQQGGVSGDAFVKVAYEEPYMDSVGILQAGRVRILILNAAHVFPEWHPHDRSRMLRCKIKYRFWGTSLEGTRQVFCVDDATEALTRNGWKRHTELSDEDEILTVNPLTKAVEWNSVDSVHRFDYDDDMVHWTNSHGFDALTTPNHRWLTVARDRNGRSHWDRPGRFMVTEELSGSNKMIVTGGGDSLAFAASPTFSDELVELIGWAVTEGHYQKPPARTGVLISQSETANSQAVNRLRLLVKHFADLGATATEQNTVRQGKYAGTRDFYFGKGIGNILRELAPDRRLTPEFLSALTKSQAELLYETLLDGDGHRGALRSDDGYDRTVQTEYFIQKDGPLVADFQMLAMMLGRRTFARAHSVHEGMVQVTAYHRKTTTARHLKDDRQHYEGVAWCPKTKNQTWVARRNGSVFVTGNTYTEILTAETIEEYLNDELIDSRPNPVGMVPVVHIPNRFVSGSPWGLPDCQDIISLNRQYNEVATSVADIINYHAEPITIITGAKASQLERGAKKIWAGLPKDAKVENLEGGYQGLKQGLEYMELVKRTMHEMVGIPETALGQSQPISNTSGVALSIQFQPLMNIWQQKTTQYGMGLQRVNELILRTLAVKEPMAFAWNPEVNSPLEPDQLPQLDLQDPLTYFTEIDWPQPLPLDKLVLLNEIQGKFALGLESREGALRLLGEAFPKVKLEEIRDELRDDALADGALGLLKAQIQSVVAEMTGMTVGPDGSAMPLPPPGMEGEMGGPTSPPMGAPPPLDPDAQAAEAEIRVKLVQQAYGANLPKQTVVRPDA